MPGLLCTPLLCIEFVIVGVLIYLLVPKWWPLLLALVLLFSFYLYTVFAFAKVLRSALFLKIAAGKGESGDGLVAISGEK